MKRHLKDIDEINKRIQIKINELADELEQPLRDSDGVNITAEQLIKAQLFTSLNNVAIIMEQVQELG